MAEFPVTRDLLRGRIEHLLGHSPRQTTITAALDSSTTTVPVASATHVVEDSVLEVDEELMHVTAVVGTDATVVRGYRGTVAAAHDDDSVARINPRHTQRELNESINVVLGNWLALYMPRVQWDTSTAGSWLPHKKIYSAPAAARGLAFVGWKRLGHTELVPLEHGLLNDYPTALISTGRGFEVTSPGLPGAPIYVQYESAWPYLDDDADTVPSDFPQEADDLIVTGAALYLTGWRIVPKYTLDESIFAREQGEGVPPNANLRMHALMRQEWVMGVQRARNLRPIGPSPKKIWVGR